MPLVRVIASVLYIKSPHNTDCLVIYFAYQRPFINTSPFFIEIDDFSCLQECNHQHLFCFVEIRLSHRTTSSQDNKLSSTVSVNF